MRPGTGRLLSGTNFYTPCTPVLSEAVRLGLIRAGQGITTVRGRRAEPGVRPSLASVDVLRIVRPADGLSARTAARMPAQSSGGVYWHAGTAAVCGVMPST
jgi:hypothetical protein